LIVAFGNPIKMSFSMITTGKFYVYILTVGDFGENVPARVAKYSLDYVSGISAVQGQPVKYF
jgi:hypothetical protein